MAKDNETKVTFKVFNQDFNRALAEMNTESKKLRQELKLEQEQLKLNGTESEKLTSVMNSLQRQYDVSKQKTQETANQLELVKKQFGDTSKEAEQMETKLRSAQIAEQQLANSLTQTIQELDKVKQAESATISETEKYKQAMQQLQNEQAVLKSSSERLTSEYNLQKAKMGENASEADKLATAQNHIRQQTDITKQAIESLERQLSLTEQEYGKNSVEANKMAARLNEAKASIANLDNELEKIKQSSNDAADGMDELGRRITAGNFLQATEILSGVADKVIELGKSAIQGTSEMADSQQNLQNNLGLTSQEAENLQSVVKNVFEQGVTESVSTASKAVQDVKMYMGDLNNTDLENVTNKVIAIGKHTETDVNENVRASSQLMTNFGIDSNMSLDLIAAGFQNGLNRSGDFLDTINEYSPQFAQAGFSANDMFNIINEGMKSGAFNTDKAADAVKEFGLKLKDGTIEKNIGKFSQGTQDLFQKFQNGQATSAQVFQSISSDIANTSNEQTKYNLGVAAFGTQYEDLGNKAIDAFSKTGHAMDDVTGKADQMAQRSPGENWQQSLRELQDALLPIGTDLINTLTPIIQSIGQMAEEFNKVPAPIRIVIEVLGGIIVLLTILAPVIIAITVVAGAFTIVNGVLTVSIGTLNLALSPILVILAVIIIVIIAVILVIRNWGAIVTWLQGIWSSFSSWISGLWQGISNAATGIWSNISLFFSNLWSSISITAITVWTGFISWISGIWQGVVTMATTIWNGIVLVFQFIWELIKAIFEGYWLIISSILIAAWNIIVALTAPIWQPIAAFFSELWNGIMFVASTVWNTLTGFFSAVWGGIVAAAYAVFVPISSLFTDVWNGIMSVTSFVWNEIVMILSTVWSAIQSAVSSSINFISSIISSIWNAIMAITSSVWNSISSAIGSVWNTISSLVSSAVNGVRDTVSSIWDGILSVTRSVWDGIKSAITGPIEAAKNTVSNILNTISGFFSGLHLSFPEIHLPPLPHFFFTGSFSLNPPSTPQLNVEWHKNGGFFDQASIIGIGEAGPEAALPLIGRRMDPFADAVANRLLSTLPQITESKLTQNFVSKQQMTFTIVSQLDGREVARNQYQYIDGMLGGEADMSALLKGDKGL